MKFISSGSNLRVDTTDLHAWIPASDICSRFTNSTCHFKDQHKLIGSFETCGHNEHVVSAVFVSSSKLVTI